MRLRTLAFVLIIMVLAVFLIINWTALSAETAVNLVYTEIRAPLGVIVVCAFGILFVLMALYMMWQQASIMLEIRAAHKEARQAKSLADGAENSRVIEMKELIKSRIDQLDATLASRLETYDQELKTRNIQIDAILKQLLEEQHRFQQEATATLNTRLNELQEHVKNALPAPRAEIVEEAKKKEIFEELL